MVLNIKQTGSLRNSFFHHAQSNRFGLCAAGVRAAGGAPGDALPAERVLEPSGAVHAQRSRRRTHSQP